MKSGKIISKSFVNQIKALVKINVMRVKSNYFLILSKHFFKTKR
jgi:hypothetical protein